MTKTIRTSWRDTFLDQPLPVTGVQRNGDASGEGEWEDVEDGDGGDGESNEASPKDMKMCRLWTTMRVVVSMCGTSDR